MPYLIGLLAVLSIVLFWISTRQRQAAGLPAGRLIYSDHQQWGRIESPLYDPTFNLTGKPDFILETEQGLIPVEVKSGHSTHEPYDSHIYQLAAYCLLIHQSFGSRPEYGILHYSNQDFAIDYTPQLEESIINLIREIHSHNKRRSMPRSHDSVARCRKCGFRKVCDQSLSN